ncbi:MAG: MBL fold metallo-hydrolase [Clostridia bacterium]|nr:MBL fold metallo-hydrolase [Clostridia bacterium]
MKQEIIWIDLEGVNCYLGKAGDSFILFDTGGHTVLDKQFTNRRDRLDKELEKAGCKPGKLKLVVLTHGDIDHVINAAYIRDKYNAKIAMHAGDLELVESPGIEKAMESFRFKSIMNRIIFMIMKKPIQKIMLKILDHFEKFKPDIYIDEGYSLKEYGLDAKVLHIPGHTAGSVAILTTNGELIAGDTLTNMKKPDIAPNALDFETLTASVDRLKRMNIKTVYPGHGKPFHMNELKI